MKSFFCCQIRPLHSFMVLLPCGAPAHTSPSDLVIPLWHHYIGHLLAHVDLLHPAVHVVRHIHEHNQVSANQRKNTWSPERLRFSFLSVHNSALMNHLMLGKQVEREVLYILWADGEVDKYRRFICPQEYLSVCMCFYSWLIDWLIDSCYGAVPVAHKWTSQ